VGFEDFIGAVLTEYGIFVTFLLFTIAALLWTIRTLWQQNKDLGFKLLETVENSTRVITQLVDKLEDHVD
jgi:hypothetical protein